MTIFLRVLDCSNLGLSPRNHEIAHRRDISSLADWCSINNLELNVATTKEFWVDFCGRPEANPKPCSSTQRFRTATDIWRWQSPSLLFCHHYNFEESPSETLLFKMVEKMWCIQQWFGPVLCNFCMVWESVRLEWKSLDQGVGHHMENRQVWPFTSHKDL